MNNNIQIFENCELGLEIKGYTDEENNLFVNTKDVAIGLGFTQVKNGKTYVRLETVNGYIRDFGFSQHVGKDFIPEPLVYLLGMKASNKTAINFQMWLSMDVLPTLRKTGSYSMEDNLQNENLLFEEDEVKFGIGSLEYYFGKIPSKDLLEQYKLCKKFYSIHRHRIIGKSIHETKIEIFDKIVEILDNRIKLTTNAQEKNRCYECITAILKDKNSSTNISNGKLIATKNRQIDRFETAFYNYKPPIDKLLQLPIHPISENIMYTTGYKISSNYDKKRKEFNEKVVPILPPLEYFGIDENTEEIVIWYGFNTVAPWVNKSGKGYDTTNLIKGIQDLIFQYYGLDDVKVKFCHALMESEYAERYEDGMIEFYMCPFKHMYNDEPVED